MKHALYHKGVCKVNGAFRGPVALFEYGGRVPGGAGAKHLASLGVEPQRKAHCIRGDGHAVYRFSFRLWASAS